HREIPRPLAPARLLAARLVARQRLVSMAVAKRLRRALLAAVAIAGILLWLVALLLLSEAVENSDDFAGILTELIVINGAGITVLVVLIVVNITQLIKDHRRHVPGSRLRVRLATLLVMVAVTPLLGVYLFSIKFVNRGIDDWLDLDLRDGLELTLEYGKDLLDERKRERREQTSDFAARLGQIDEDQYARTLSTMRAETGASELTVFGPGNRIIATSAGFNAFAVPRQLSREMQLTQEL